MAPELAGKSPDSRLMSVVLPAPFGPTTACNSPRLISMDTSATAINPLKRRDKPRVPRTTSLIVGCLGDWLAKLAADALDATGQENDQQNDREPERQLPMRRERRIDLLQG